MSGLGSFADMPVPTFKVRFIANSGHWYSAQCVTFPLYEYTPWLASYVERPNLSLRMGSRRFTRLTNGFSKKLDNHVAVALYVAHYNLCRVHEALRMTPAKAIGIADRTWNVGDLIDAALATQPIAPVTSAPDRRKMFKVIDGGRQ